MTLLMTEVPHVDCTTAATRKRRRMEHEDDTEQVQSDSMAAKSINPVNQVNPISMIAPDFNCAAVLNNEICRVQLSTLLTKHKAVILFFYECDFTPSACKDLLSINNYYERFMSLNALPIAMSTDTEMVHTAFMNQPTLGFTPSFPLVADTTRSVSGHFNVIDPNTGLGNRAVYIIDSSRQVQFSFVIEDNRISHSMDTICAMLHRL